MTVDILDAVSPDLISIEQSGAAGELDGYNKYKFSYFERFGSGIWCQGDFVQRLPNTGGLVMLGRSDGVLRWIRRRDAQQKEIFAVTGSFQQCPFSPAGILRRWSRISPSAYLATPLVIAAAPKRWGAASILVNHGADVKSEDAVPETALSYAQLDQNGGIDAGA
ncbi:hypothetical protein F5884DRAFT_862608 [Xylogone sp. PMI_703]|nr:hypothetical protein F5884DRAFT_862608 [Xylogone sp. PMI_703]